MTGEYAEFIGRMRTSGVSQEEAFAFFDSLEPVTSEFMLGSWKGVECRTGHIMDGMLTVAPWYGKEFKSAEDVSPLVFEDRRGRLYCGDPRRIFGLVGSKPVLKLATALSGSVVRGERSADPHAFDALIKLFKTKRSHARLREISYRGTVTAAMVYDELAIIDVFRRLGSDSVLGVMDIKGELGSKGYFFTLERC